MIPKAALSITASDGPVDQREALIDGVAGGELILNVRAEADPALLQEITAEALERVGGERLELVLEHEEHFRPGRPTPTHRDLVREEAT